MTKDVVAANRKDLRKILGKLQNAQLNAGGICPGPTVCGACKSVTVSKKDRAMSKTE